MAWNPQGGGGQGPWGSGPSGPQPPDIEELLRRGQDRFKRFMPGGVGTSRGIILILFVVLGLWLASGIFRVDSGHQGVVLLFGKHVQSADPGLHWFFPSPIGDVLTPDVEQVRRVDIGFRTATGNRNSGAVRDISEESLMLTGDQNIADLDFAVQWKVKDAGQFLFNIRDPESTVKAAAESAMREVVGQTELQAALTGGRKQIEDKTRVLLQEILDSYETGITITIVQLQKVDPPTAVIDAFNEVQRARQDKDRKRNEAEAYRNRIVPTARGEAEQIIQEARAYKEKSIKEAEGEAQRFLLVFETYKVAKDVTTQRIFLESLQEVLKGANKVIIDSNSAGGSGVVPYLPLNELQKGTRGATQ
jgi:modulator of FtsH protease HflK